jgi:SpoVK/Ycf46/Vps4 family AAA+-type ATPase
MVSSSEINFIIEALQPDFIMVDDVDKADVNHSLPAILGILQELKQHKTKTSLLLTANTVAGFDHGLLRPGRIDTWMTFDPPNADDRRNIINGYLAEAKHVVSEDVVENFVKITADLTQDYLREIAQRLKYEEIEEVVDVIMSMRKLLRKPDLNVPVRVEVAEETKPNGKSNGEATLSTVSA